MLLLLVLLVPLKQEGRGGKVGGSLVAHELQRPKKTFFTPIPHNPAWPKKINI